jgi:hypothetical protein
VRSGLATWILPVPHQVTQYFSEETHYMVPPRHDTEFQGYFWFRVVEKKIHW